MIDPTVLQARHSAKVIEKHGGRITSHEDDHQSFFLKGHIFIHTQPKGFEECPIMFGSGRGIPKIKFCSSYLDLEQAEKTRTKLISAIAIIKKCSQTRKSQLRWHEERKRGAESQIKNPDHPFLEYHQKTYDDAVRWIKQINEYWESLEEEQL